MTLFPPKKILVALDGSTISYNAWLHAKLLAQRFGSTLEAVYISEHYYAAAMADIGEESLESIRRHIQKKIKGWLNGYAPLKVLRGLAQDEILRLAKTRKYELVVMGTHGRRGLDRALLGSVAEEVVRRSPVPVLVVKNKPKRVKSILAPVNFMPYCQDGFDLAVHTALAFKAQLVALHVAQSWRQTAEVSDQFGDLMRAVPLSLRKYSKIIRSMEAGSPIEEILSESRQHDLLVLTAHRKKLLKETILGSTVERLLRYTATPILCMPWLPSGASKNGKLKTTKTIFAV